MIKVIILILFFLQCNLAYGYAEDSKVKIVLIGIGGATWKAMLPLIKQNRLPNLEKLINKGMWGELFIPPGTSSALNSIVTGVEEKDGGLYGYCDKLNGEYVAPLIPSYTRRTKALWDILTDNNRKVGVVNWWATSPAEKVNGSMISNAFFFEMIKKDSPYSLGEHRLVYPPGVSDRLKELIPLLNPEIEQRLSDIMGYKIKANNNNEEPSHNSFDIDVDSLSGEAKEAHLLGIIKRFLKEDLFVSEVGEYFLEKEIPDLFVIFFRGLDAIQHCFWEFYEPEDPECNFAPTRKEIDKFKMVIPRYYELMDELIGRILVNYQNEKKLIIAIISDHGFKGDPFWRYKKNFSLNFIFEKFGWLKYGNDGKIDWRKTAIYDFPHDITSRTNRKVYVNLKGRDTQGIVSRSEYDQFLYKVKERLKSLKTTRGQKIISKIKKVAINNNNSQIQFPDLLVEFNQFILFNPDTMCEINNKIYSIKEFMSPLPRSGRHDNEGVIIFCNPSIEKGERIENVTVYDIMPTILNLIDISAQEETAKKALPNVLKIKDYLQ